MTDTLEIPSMEDLIVEDGASSPSDAATITGLDPCKCQQTHDTIDGACDQFLPLVHGNRRVKCDGCQAGGWIHASKKAKKDTPPVGITVNLPKPGVKFDSTQEKVREAATAWLTMISQGLMAVGDEVCGKAVETAAPQIALQLAILSKFHPVIVKILAPVEATGEALAWLSLSMALAPVVLVVLVHHNVLTEEQAKRFGVIAMMGAVVQATPTTEAQAA